MANLSKHDYKLLTANTYMQNPLKKTSVEELLNGPSDVTSGPGLWHWRTPYGCIPLVKSQTFGERWACYWQLYQKIAILQAFAPTSMVCSLQKKKTQWSVHLPNVATPSGVPQKACSDVFRHFLRDRDSAIDERFMSELPNSWCKAS